MTYTNPADIQGTSSSNYACHNNTNTDRNILLDWTPQIDLYPFGGTGMASYTTREALPLIPANMSWTRNNDPFTSTTWFITVSGSYYLQAVSYIEAKTGDSNFGISPHFNITVN